MSTSSLGLPNIESSRPRSFDNLSKSPPTQKRRYEKPALSEQEKIKAQQTHQILRDLVYVFQGIDGQYIRFDSTTDEYLVDKRLSISLSTQQLVYRLTETGWLYTLIRRFIERGPKGLVGQSLCAAIRNELKSYYQSIAAIEAQVEAQIDHDRWDQDLTLKGLLVWIDETNEKLRLLTLLADASHGYKGGALVNILHNHTKHGDPFIKEFITQILDTISQPFYAMIQSWVYEGELDDPFEEFFVACNVDAPQQEMWKNKYSIREDMLPSFISKELALKIFSIGKSLNFIRYSCHHRIDVSQNNTLFKYDQVQTLERSILVIYKETSQFLLDLLKTKYRLMDHLRALKRYLFLGQGDCIEYLMDILGPQLDQPASQLFRHHLTSVLETAVRSSNAQYDDPEILQKLDVRLLEAQRDDLGWDVFSLDYRVDTPLDTVIHSGAMTQYLQIFNFLWRLKRIQYTLSTSWKQCGKSGRQFSHLPELLKDLREIQMTIQKMIHFIYQLQHYVLFEVLECSWEKLENEIENNSVDLDSIIQSHTHYLKEIIEKGFLHGRKKTALAPRLNQLFDCILKYKAILEHLCLYADQQTASVYTRFGLREEEKLENIRRHRREIEDTFTTQTLQFLEALRSYHDEDLRSLSTRLDYNSFYSK
ncbi:Spc98 family-domain-containing protein [Sporodiniella umbellata]|nr:Spc98 family-domain-containing protein [Sporodiniella umbellata]